MKPNIHVGSFSLAMAVGKHEVFIPIKGTSIRTCKLVQFYLFHILTILGWRTLTPQGSYAERGRPMTTGAHSGGDDHGRASTLFCLEEEELLEDL